VGDVQLTQAGKSADSGQRREAWPPQPRAARHPQHAKAGCAGEGSMRVQGLGVEDRLGQAGRTIRTQRKAAGGSMQPPEEQKGSSNNGKVLAKSS